MQKLKNNEARPKFTGSSKEKACNAIMVVIGRAHCSILCVCVCVCIELKNL